MENPNFHLTGIIRDRDELQDFVGPLSLILSLLQKNKIEIKDLQISQILDQYLAWMAEMQSMDLEIASEFVQMAAHLLYIKTRTLLSAEEEVSELEVLKESLEQLKAKDTLGLVRQVLPALKTASDRGMLYFPKLPEPLPKGAKDYEYRHEPVDLLKALQSVFTKGILMPEEEENLNTAIPGRILFSVRSKSRQLLELLRQGPALLEDLYHNCSSRSEIVATFLSVLELCSLGSIRLDREESGYRLSFVGGELDEVLEKIEE